MNRHVSVVSSLAVLASFPDWPYHRLVALYKPITGGSDDINDDIRLFLRRQLPLYAVPMYFIEVEDFPLTQHMKVHSSVTFFFNMNF